MTDRPFYTRPTRPTIPGTRIPGNPTWRMVELLQDENKRLKRRIRDMQDRIEELEAQHGGRYA